MNRPETEPGARKLENSKCSVSNQISGGGQIWLLKLLYGFKSPRNLTQTYLFMIQVENMLFLQFWVRAFQALPNSSILILASPNMTGKPKNYFHQSRNNHLSLNLHLPVNSLHYLQGKTISFIGKLLQNQFWRWIWL